MIKKRSMMNKRERIIDEIFKRKDEMGVSRYKLSKDTGISEGALKLMEEKRGMTLSSFLKICDALKLKINLEKVD